MLTPDTDARLAAAYRALRADQAAGQAPPPGEVSLAEYARRAGCSPATVHSIERSACAKLLAGCQRVGITPADLRQILTLITR